MSETIHVCAGANERFMIGAIAAFTGIALNAKAETQLHFHIFTEGVKPETVDFMRQTLLRHHKKTVVEEHVCDEKLLEGLPYWAGSRLSAARVFFPYLLKDVDWALYIDCDVLYFASPEEHWSYRNDDAFACVTQEEGNETKRDECAWARRECGVDMPESEYFNAGVMLFNFKKCREEKIPDRIHQFYEDHPDVRLPDQTAMNVLFHGHKVMLPAKYDRLQFNMDDMRLKEHPVIHYVMGNPWLPKLGVTANDRFRLWHDFCDKYIWQETGASYRHCFSGQIIWLKIVSYSVLKMPFVGQMFAGVLQMLGRTGDAKSWRWVETHGRLSRASVCEILK